MAYVDKRVLLVIPVPLWTEGGKLLTVTYGLKLAQTAFSRQ